LGAIKVELVKVSLNPLAVDNERRELVGVELTPLEESHRAFMHEVHSPCVNGDVSPAKGCDDCGGSIETDEMHYHITMILESSRYAETDG